MTERSIGEMIRRADYLRRSNARWEKRNETSSGHKEWLHFCAYGEDVDLLVNFSLVDDTRPTVAWGTEIARITCLTSSRHGWDGDVEQIPSDRVRIVHGSIDLGFDSNSVEFRDGAYHIQVRLKQRPVEMSLTFTPVAYPSQANNVHVDDCPPIHWMFVPRLEVSGHLIVGERRYSFDRAPGYHDHNWGYFRWGRNFTWEWGAAQPRERSNPWCLVYARLMDRGHLTNLMQGLFIYEHATQRKVFRARDLRISHQGFLDPRRIFKLPRVMGILSPGTASDVPAQLIIEASQARDHLSCLFEAEEVGQVIIPNDDDSRVTIINEVAGRFTAEGLIGGRRMSLTTRSVFEFLGA